MDSKLLSFLIIIFFTSIKAETSPASIWKLESEKPAVSKYKDSLLNPQLLKFLSKCYEPKCCVLKDALTCYTYFEILYQNRMTDISNDKLNATLRKYQTPLTDNELSTFCKTLSERLPSKPGHYLTNETFFNTLNSNCEKYCTSITDNLSYNVSDHCAVLYLLLEEAQTQKLTATPTNTSLNGKSTTKAENITSKAQPPVEPKEQPSSNGNQQKIEEKKETPISKSNITESNSKDAVSIPNPNIPNISNTPLPAGKPSPPNVQETIPKEEDHTLNATGENEWDGNNFDNPAISPDDSMNEENRDDDMDDSFAPAPVDNKILPERKVSPEHKEVKMPANDPFVEDTGSNFFSYFLFGMFACIVLYVVYNNKTKILALIVEGRQSQGGRSGRRKHTAAYRKLDTNLEEAITSSTSGRGSQVIY